MWFGAVQYDTSKENMVPGNESWHKQHVISIISNIISLLKDQRYSSCTERQAKRGNWRCFFHPPLLWVSLLHLLYHQMVEDSRGFCWPHAVGRRWRLGEEGAGRNTTRFPPASPCSLLLPQRQRLLPESKQER